MTIKEEIEHQWRLTKFLQESDYYSIAIPKTQLLSSSYDYLLGILKKLSKDRRTLLNSHSKLNLFFPDYDLDKREIFEIPEARKWILETIDYEVPWVYFAEIDSKKSFFALFLFSYLTELGILSHGGQFAINFSEAYMKEFFRVIFNNLNSFTNENRIPEDVNRSITASIGSFFDMPARFK